MAVVPNKQTSPCRPPDVPAGSPTGIRRSKATRWRVGVLIGVHLLFALHIAHLWTSGSTLTPVEPSEAMEFSKHSVVNAGLVFFAVAILATLVFGRFFCGWGCHIVALQDLARAFLIKLGIHPKPLRSRALALVPLVAFIYMFLFPIAYRIWIGDSFDEGHNAFFTSDFWRTFPGLAIALLTFAICGFAIVYFLGAKGFCTYACPYGAIFGAVDHLAPGRIRVTDACEGCGHCTIACTSNVAVHKEVRDFGMVVDAGCMKCMDCVSVCPKDALYFGFGKPGLGAKPRREPKKRAAAWSLPEEVFFAVAFLVAFFAFRGLYSATPFLLSLGIGSIAALATLYAWRLVSRTEVRLQNLTLKDGRLTRSGWGFAAAFSAFALFWVHSGWIQFHTNRAESAMVSLEAASRRFRSPNPAPLDAMEREQLASLVRHNGLAERYGLVPTSEGAYRTAYTYLFERDLDNYDHWLGQAVELEQHRDKIVHEYAGFLASVKSDLVGAERMFRRATEITDQPAQAALRLAQFLANNKGDIAASRGAAAEGLAKEPNSAELHAHLGALSMVQGDATAAKASFQEAVELAPAQFDIRNRLVQLLFMEGSVEPALQLLRDAVELTPQGATEHAALGFGALSAGRLDEAEAAFERARELDADGTTGAQEGLGEVRRLRSGPGAPSKTAKKP